MFMYMCLVPVGEWMWLCVWVRLCGSVWFDCMGKSGGVCGCDCVSEDGSVWVGQPSLEVR